MHFYIYISIYLIGGGDLATVSWGSGDLGWPGNQVNMHFTHLPQALEPQREKNKRIIYINIYIWKMILSYFYFALWYFVYFIKLIVLEHFYFFKKKKTKWKWSATNLLVLDCRGLTGARASWNNLDMTLYIELCVCIGCWPEHRPLLLVVKSMGVLTN